MIETDIKEQPDRSMRKARATKSLTPKGSGFELDMGSVLAGNDNISLIKKLEKNIRLMVKQGRLDKTKASDALKELKRYRLER
jgi:hypothetical protein